MPSAELETLVLAILSLIQSTQGFATKTKLLKLLYLVDVERYREAGHTATGFTWKFHKYGPWTAEYDHVIENLRERDLISITPGTKPDLDTQFVRATIADRDYLSDLGWPFRQQQILRRIVKTWADRPTGEILDYAYFHTEPMVQAGRGRELDFSAVQRGEHAEFYRKTVSTTNEQELREARKAFRCALAQSKPKSIQASGFTPPKYDAEFWAALEVIQKSSD